MGFLWATAIGFVFLGASLGLPAVSGFVTASLGIFTEEELDQIEEQEDDDDDDPEPDPDLQHFLTLFHKMQTRERIGEVFPW